ncbi:hypothetical protein [Aeromonas phage 51]|uniref:DUF4942 domain-containing protein n=3 Tax=Popoffvirus pv56 TaxID=2560283 RepID=A0A219YBC8_9CAUD|nr:DNA methyltransferase [Aeromonas phage vB_AsaM-56]AFC22635.1 putative methylase [Aeromonas phage vB_AsaM-56]APU01262.1 hypothetical protein [Aeromonas phage 51]APU01346.1 hypothetical protein [Aeromonas phage 56]
MGGTALSTATGSGFFAPVDTSLIGALLTTHKRIEASIGAVDNFMRSDECRSALGFYLAACREDQGRIGLKVDGLMQKDKALAALHADYWDKALRLTDVLECMPQKRRDEWYELIRSHATPPFDDEAVYLTLQDMLNSRERFLAERVEGIFRALSGEHVTNSPAAFGKRMIIYVMTSYGTTNYTNEGHITDLRKIIARFMGRDEPSGFGVTTRVIQAAMAQTGEWLAIDGGAMRIRCYKKGTAHLEIHPDMAWRLNAILALLYPSAIPAEFRTAPKRKARDIELIQKPIPFKVVEALANATEHSVLDEAGYRKVRRVTPNSLVLKTYEMDKFIVRQAGAVLESIGGAKRKAGHYLFDYDPKRIVNEIIASGCVPDHKSHQFYPTPQELAELAVGYADIEDGMAVLEPSAGQGGIADYLPAGSMLVEVSALHCEILKEKGHSNVVQGDFLNISLGKFDRIVMNPPFSDGRWQAHVEHAAGMLADCGVLVAIVPSSANEKFKIPGFVIEWLGVYDDCFAGTSVSVAMMRVTHG